VPYRGVAQAGQYLAAGNAQRRGREKKKEKD